jgi:CubicO group peptidase (beta-lactamase class C family)
MLAALVDCVAFEYLRQKRAAGAVIAVETRGQRAIRAYGYGDLLSRERCAPDTQFWIGSISKQFTAAAILQLVDAGLLALDERVAGIMPSNLAYPSDLRIHHLLSHTGGLSGKLDRQLQDGAEIPHVSVDWILSQPLDFAPGTRWQYSNAGYSLLALLLESVTECSYAEYVTEELVERVGLKNTTVGSPRASGVAVGHAPIRGQLGSVAAPSPDATFGSGSLYSTAGDLLIWSRALASGVVSAGSFQRMTTPVTLTSGEATTYGLGLYVSDYYGHLELSHDGHGGGHSSQLALYPEDDVAIVVTNGAEHGAEGIEKAIAREILGVQDPPVLDLGLPDGESERYTGRFASGSGTVPIWTDDAHLFVRIPSGREAHLLYQGTGTFSEASDTGTQYRFRPDGSLQVCRNGKVLAWLHRCADS